MIRGERHRRGDTRVVLASVLAACALALTVAGAAAEDTTETNAFGQDGIATQSLGTHFYETEFSSLETRPDGGLLARRGDQLEAYLASGAADPAAPPREVSPYREAFPLAGGKILVVSDERNLTRTNADGSIDSSFGGTGTIKAPVWVQQAAELPSGKVLVASASVGGTHTIFTSVAFALINQDGSVDQEPGRDGIGGLTLNYNYWNNANIVAIAPAGDGALLVGNSFLLMLRADGSPDPGFGSSGLVAGLPELAGAQVRADGSVEAVGSEGPAGQDLVVLRYTASGTPDLGFGSEGRRRFDLGGSENARAALWTADGSALVGGSATETGPCKERQSCVETPLLAAFGPDGNLDPGFGGGGVLRLTSLAGTPNGGWRGNGVAALVRRPDGSIVAAGGAPPGRTVAFLAALTPQGALLPSFGEGGIVRARRTVPASQATLGLAPLPDGKLLAGGTTDVGIDDTVALIRYQADGSLDRSFGDGDGFVSVDDSRFAMGFAADPGGRALIGAYHYPRSRLLLRNPDGAPVSSFGSDGAVELPRHVRIKALGFSHGHAIVVGTRDVAGDREPGIVLRLDSAGRPDPRFGHAGRFLPHPGGREMRARALATEARERMLVGGLVHGGFALTRLLPDGRPDPGFGVHGWALPRVGGTAKAVALARSGAHIYLAGLVRAGDQLRVVLLRFRTDGRLDPGFGHRGRRGISIAKPAQPSAIVATRHGILVALGNGTEPLLLFGRGGEVRRQPVGARPEPVTDVRATVLGDRLVLGWNAFSTADERDVYSLASRPLP